MFRSRFTAAAMLAASVGAGASAVAVVAAPGAGAATARRASGSPVLKIASVKVAIGATNKAHQLLVDAKGLPVYLLTGDSKSHPLCSGNCLTYWPAVTTTSMRPTLGRGVKGKVGVWHHGKIDQVTLNGHPLYTYVQDHKGAALGEGLKSFGGVWEVMSAGGSAMAKSSGKSGGSSGGSSGGGSGW